MLEKLLFWEPVLGVGLTGNLVDLAKRHPLVVLNLVQHDGPLELLARWWHEEVDPQPRSRQLGGHVLGLCGHIRREVLAKMVAEEIPLATPEIRRRHFVRRLSCLYIVKVFVQVRLIIFVKELVQVRSLEKLLNLVQRVARIATCPLGCSGLLGSYIQDDVRRIVSAGIEGDHVSAPPHDLHPKLKRPSYERKRQVSNRPIPKQSLDGVVRGHLILAFWASFLERRIRWLHENAWYHCSLGRVRLWPLRNQSCGHLLLQPLRVHVRGFRDSGEAHRVRRMARFDYERRALELLGQFPPIERGLHEKSAGRHLPNRRTRIVGLGDGIHHVMHQGFVLDGHQGRLIR
mmetsp:Transcript_11058/g.32794  ORF Transcript_11058/g.32794 Transcript_11058/m.32794 type:complete len:345 (-) Transcript_11058:281-1315(-)